MKIGKVRITNELIANSLKFPIDWQIEKIIPSVDKCGNVLPGESTMLISGSAFPEINDSGEIEEVEIIYHKENIWYEVKKLRKATNEQI